MEFTYFMIAISMGGGGGGEGGVGGGGRGGGEHPGTPLWGKH